ncbi:MAG: NADPH-dependent FMN reductase, partial [Phycisphaerales bacterium]
AGRIAQSKGIAAEVVDIAPLNLPLCDGAAAYGHPAVAPLAAKVAGASSVIMCVPIYNYSVAASAKNVIELVGKAFTGKVVGLAAAAGGGMAYTAPLQLANALMLDFRCVIVPRYVYVAGKGIDAGAITDAEIVTRLTGLVEDVARMGSALAGVSKG